MAWNLTQATFEPRHLLQASAGRWDQEEEKEPFFVDYAPPAKDAITLPRHVVYVLVAVALVVVALYAIVGHLVNDLMHDLADWILGPKPVDMDSEQGLEEEEDKRSVYDERMWREKRSMKTKEERVGLLPGYYDPTNPPPLHSALSTFPSERSVSNQNMT